MRVRNCINFFFYFKNSSGDFFNLFDWISDSWLICWPLDVSVIELQQNTLLKVLCRNFGSVVRCGIASIVCLAGENSRSKYSRESTTKQNGRVRWHRQNKTLGKFCTQSYWSIVTVHRPFCSHHTSASFFFSPFDIILADELVAVCCEPPHWYNWGTQFLKIQFGNSLNNYVDH